jgi:AraC family transcriptional regulator, transcriptional activator of pobA
LRPAPFLQLYDPRNGDLSLRVDPLDTPDDLSAPQRTNFFTVFWIQEGQGTFCAESGEYPFAAQSLLFLVPYQSFKFISGPGFRGLCLRFHANFLCIETYHEEVGCNGILFNDTCGVPCVNLEECHAQEAAALLDEISRELREGGLAHSEVLLSYLKIFLVRATRLKMQQQELASAPPGRIPEVLTNLKRLIEEHFRTRHAPADYAEMLHIVPKSLARLVRMHLNKTLTELIRERIIRQAKWELLHTQKPVKDVAAGLGFEDIFYFSRLFKRSTGCSPTFFREFETEIRGDRNLSMR